MKTRSWFSVKVAVELHVMARPPRREVGTIGLVMSCLAGNFPVFSTRTASPWSAVDCSAYVDQVCGRVCVCVCVSVNTLERRILVYSRNVNRDWVLLYASRYNVYTFRAVQLSVLFS